MTPLPGCDHPRDGDAHQACDHLLAANDVDYHRWYTGEGLRYAAICAACAADARLRDAALRGVCRGCFARITSDNCWDGSGGAPGVAERPSGLRLQHREVALPAGCPAPILALAPIDAAASPLWVALAADGRLVRLDLERGSAETLAALPTAGLQLDAPLAIRLSADGRLAAVVNSYGRFGLVLDLHTGATTMALDRGDYHEDVSQFSVAFCAHADRPLLVHATDWNRLDISDPRTGDLLTPRGPTSYLRGEERPEHYLDYFHCGLSVSPGQEWVVDNGWFWHPIGIVTAWSLRRWLSENPWESEDGPTRRALCDRAYLWDAPLCWVDDTTVAVWGEGRDDEQMLPAVQLFDVASGARIGGFAGPDVAPPTVWPPGQGRPGWLAFDRWLFAVSPERGTGVWDVATGERLLHDPACAPVAYHRGARQFLSILPGGRLQISTLGGE